MQGGLVRVAGDTGQVFGAYRLANQRQGDQDSQGSAFERAEHFNRKHVHLRREGEAFFKIWKYGALAPQLDYRANRINVLTVN